MPFYNAGTVYRLRDIHGVAFVFGVNQVEKIERPAFYPDRQSQLCITLRDNEGETQVWRVRRTSVEAYSALAALIHEDDDDGPPADLLKMARGALLPFADFMRVVELIDQANEDRGPLSKPNLPGGTGHVLVGEPPLKYAYVEISYTDKETGEHHVAWLEPDNFRVARMVLNRLNMATPRGEDDG